MSNRELIEWHIYYDPELWKTKLADTPEGRSQQLMQLFMGKNGS